MDKQVTVIPSSASFLWVIKRFMGLEYYPQPLRSQIFSPIGSKDSWQLEIEMSGNHPIIRVHFVKRGDEHSLKSLEVLVGIQFMMGDFNESQELKDEVTPGSFIIFEWIHTDWSTDDYLVSKLFESAQIACCIYYTPTDLVLDGQTPSGSTCIQDLQTFLSSSLDTSLPPDLALVASDGETVMTHKFLLFARSEVFRCMFSHECEESKTSQIKMIDFSSAVLRDFVDFLRTDRVTDPNGNAADLFILGDKYAIPQLKSVCEQFLSQNIREDNQTRLLQLVTSIRSDMIEKALLMFLQDKNVSNAQKKKNASSKNCLPL